MKLKNTFLLLFTCAAAIININIVSAAMELTCYYEGGLQNSATMISQNKDGKISVATNYKGGDRPARDDENWYYYSGEEYTWTLDFSDTRSYPDNELESCPPYVQHPWGSTFKLAFHDKTSWDRLDYANYDSYEGTPNHSSFKQTFYDDDDYSYEINNTEWLGVCYYGDDSTADSTIYFNNDKYIIDIHNTMVSSIYADFTLEELLAAYKRLGTCPTIYNYSTFYAVVGNSFFTYDYSLEYSTQNSMILSPHSGSHVVPIEGETTPKVEKCESLLGSPNDTDPKSPAYYLSFVFSVLRYVAIIILIVFSIIDFVGASASQDDNELKKALGKVIKRAILCILIFILPTLLDVLLQFLHESAIKDCIDINF